MNLVGLFFKRIDKQGWFRNVVIIFAIMLATTILLSALALANGMATQFKREQKWEAVFGSSFVAGSSNDIVKDLSGDTTNKILFTTEQTSYGERTIMQGGMRKMSAEADLPTVLAREPEKNEIIVSPKLMDLIEGDEYMKERYAGYKISTDFPMELLESPDALVLIYYIPDEFVALAKQEVPDMPTRLVDAVTIETDLVKDWPTSSSMSQIIEIMMVTCGVGVCFPLLVLMMSAIRIGMKQREQRFAALSLLGASKRQINAIILSETLAAGALGLFLGVGLYLAVRILVLQKIAFNGEALFLEDMTVGVSRIMAVSIGILLVLMIVNSAALRKVKTSPLGVAREIKLVRRPRVWRLLPLLMATGLIIWLNVVVKAQQDDWLESSGDVVMLAFVGAFLLLMVGLLTSGAYLTYVISRVMGVFGRRAPGVMAAKRMQRFAAPIYASVSGVVLALFVGSFFMTTVSTVQAIYEKESSDYTTYLSLSSKEAVSDAVRYALVSDSEEDAASVIKAVEGRQELEDKIAGVYRLSYFSDVQAEIGGLVYRCGDLVLLTQLRCEAGLSEDTEVVAVMDIDKHSYSLMEVDKLEGERWLWGVAWKLKTPETKKQMQKFLQAYGFTLLAETGRSGAVMQDDNSSYDVLAGVRGLVDAVMVGTVATIFVGALSLAVAMIGGFFERQKSFYDLRLMGVGMPTLNLVVILESFLPLILAAGVALIVGILAARYLLEFMVASDTAFVFRLPDAGYFVAVGVSLLAALAIVVAILPILKQITSLEANREE